MEQSSIANLADVQAVEQEERALLVRVYWLMVLGLAITATVGFLAFRDPLTLQYVSAHPLSFQVLFLLEVVSVAVLSRIVDKMSIGMVWVAFLGYAALNGFSFAVFFSFVPPGSVATAFFVCCVTFAVMAWYGRSQGEDLGSARNVFLMFALGFALTCMVNLVAKHTTAYYGASTVLLVVFCWLVSVHSQDIRDFDWAFDDDDKQRTKAALTGALLLCLDCVNVYFMATRMFVVRAQEEE